MRWRCCTRRARRLNLRSPEMPAAPLGDRLAEASYQLTDLTADLVRYLERAWTASLDAWNRSPSAGLS